MLFAMRHNAEFNLVYVCDVIAFRYTADNCFACITSDVHKSYKPAFKCSTPKYELTLISHS